MQFLVITICACLLIVKAKPYVGTGLGGSAVGVMPGYGLGAGSYGGGGSYSGQGYQSSNGGYGSQGYHNGVHQYGHDIGAQEHDYDSSVHSHHASSHNTGGGLQVDSSGHSSGAYGGHESGRGGYGNTWHRRPLMPVV